MGATLTADQKSTQMKTSEQCLECSNRNKMILCVD
jgi:hypothetical protein